MTATTPLLAALALSRNPFPPTPDAGSYFFTPHLQEQFAEVMHCIEARKGFVLLTGDVGLGKSTLVRRLLDTLPPGSTCSALVLNTFLQEAALLAAVLRDFGLQATGNLDADLSVFNEFLLSRHREGKTCLLVIDDAQNLTVQSLELVRLLSNLETGQEKLLQILLAGQPELETILAGKTLRQLKSRIVKHALLRGLRPTEAARYVEFRITAAGGAGRISLAPPAARLLHQVTQGNLRQMHLVLDRCLYGLVALGKGVIDRSLLALALKDVALRRAPAWPTGRFVGTLSAGLAAALALGGTLLLTAGQPASTAALLPPRAAVASGPVVDPAPPRSGGDMDPDTAENCFLRVQKNASSGAVVSHMLPPSVALKLKASAGVCLFSQQQRIWATWRADPRLAQILQALPNDATRDMQRKLVLLGWLKPNKVDGVTGPLTYRALQAFQESLALPATGKPDELTYMLLESLYAS